MQNNKSNYNKHLKLLARNLRNNSTQGEVLLWSELLKSKKMMRYNFNRQFSLKLDNKNIIVDFICRKLKMVIEVDGYSHNFKHEEDKQRDLLLNKFGYSVVRISEKDIKTDINNVAKELEYNIKKIEINPPTPFSKGEINGKK